MPVIYINEEYITDIKCRKLNICTPPTDTSVNTCKPELTHTSKVIFNLRSRYCSYSRSLRVKHGDVVETQ